MSPRPLCDAVLSKIQEQIERTVHLIHLVPAECLNWKPAADSWPADVLLGHLLEALAGFCAVLAAAEPQRLGHFAGLRKLPVNHACSPQEAAERIGVYRYHIEEGLALLDDRSLGRIVPTAFVKAGEPVMTLLLGNLEHLINHKHQLFAYLKQMGVHVGTRDLYHFRGED
jgi:DinB superfamily